MAGEPMSRQHSRVGQKGLTIVELMVSMAIGLVVLTTVSTLYVQHNRHQADLDRKNRLIDNGRYAMDLLTETLQMSGFYGEFDPSSAAVPAALPDPCDAAVSELRSGLAFHVQGYDAPDTASAASAVPSCVADARSGSDILVVRRASVQQTALAAAVAGTRYIQGSLCENDASRFVLDSVLANFTLRPLNCAAGTAAPLNRFIQEIYFIANNNQAGDGIPTLKRVELQDDGTFGDPVPLVDGVEFMQLDYGMDNTSDGVADAWASCEDNTCDSTWNRVVAARVHLVVRNTDASQGYSDARTYDLGLGGTYTPTGAATGFRRNVYVQTIKLVNTATRLEKP